MRAPRHLAGALSCVAVNVNGLNGDAKRSTLFRRLHEEQPAVAVLCETHCEGDVRARAWEQEGAGPGRPWLGHAAWHHGTRQSRGVAVLVDPRFVDGAVTVHHRDGTGRILLVGFTDRAAQRWQVMAVYAPAEVAERHAFFDGPFSQPPVQLVIRRLGCWLLGTSTASWQWPICSRSSAPRLPSIVAFFFFFSYSLQGKG